MACAIFYMHQTSGVCAGVCMCDRMHQMEKTDTEVESDLFYLLLKKCNLVVKGYHI